MLNCYSMMKNNYYRPVNVCIARFAKRGRVNNMNLPTILYVVKESYSIVQFLFLSTKLNNMERFLHFLYHLQEME